MQIQRDAILASSSACGKSVMHHRAGQIARYQTLRCHPQGKIRILEKIGKTRVEPAGQSQTPAPERHVRSVKLQGFPLAW